MSSVKIYAASSSATAPAECAGNVLVSGSYGGEYNAYHAAKWGIRGVVLNDAGVGKNDAGIKGLPYLDRIGLAGATADAMTCHIADAEHMLDHGRISHVNRSAGKLGCRVGHALEPDVLVGPVAMRHDQRHVHALGVQHAQAAVAHVVIGEDYGAHGASGTSVARF